MDKRGHCNAVAIVDVDVNSVATWVALEDLSVCIPDGFAGRLLRRKRLPAGPLFAAVADRLLLLSVYLSHSHVREMSILYILIADVVIHRYELPPLDLWSFFLLVLLFDPCIQSSKGHP